MEISRIDIFKRLLESNCQTSYEVYKNNSKVNIFRNYTQTQNYLLNQEPSKNIKIIKHTRCDESHKFYKKLEK